MDQLLRRRETPQEPAFLELFFDLVYVFAFTRVSQRLFEALDFTGDGNERWLALLEGGKTLLLLLALLWVWFLTAWMTNTFNPEQPAIQALVAATTFASLVMAIALPRAFAERGLAFAGAYVVIQILRPLFLGILLRDHPLRFSAHRILFWSAVPAVPWIAGAVAYGAARGALWTLAVVIDYGAAKLAFPTPVLGRARAAEWVVGSEHLAERYRQFVLIAFGESILVIGFAFSATEFETERGVALPVTFATTALLWRIYLHRAGAILASAIAASRQPARLGQSAAYTHLLMTTGIVLTGLGHELVIIHPLGGTEPAWLAGILGGPALFLAGRARFEFVVFARVSRSRFIGLLALAAIAPAAAFAPPLGIAIAVAVVLAGIALSDARRARRGPPEAPSPPV